MESITSPAEEVLVDSLSFELSGSGQYVQERRSVTFIQKAQTVTAHKVVPELFDSN